MAQISFYSMTYGMSCILIKIFLVITSQPRESEANGPLAPYYYAASGPLASLLRSCDYVLEKTKLKLPSEHFLVLRENSTTARHCSIKYSKMDTNNL